MKPADALTLAVLIAISAATVWFIHRPHHWLDWWLARHHVTSAAEHITRQAAAGPYSLEEDNPS